MLGVLASYSITVKELKLLFGSMKTVSGRWVSRFIYMTLLYLHEVMMDRAVFLFKRLDCCSLRSISETLYHLIIHSLNLVMCSNNCMKTNFFPRLWTRSVSKMHVLIISNHIYGESQPFPVIRNVFISSWFLQSYTRRNCLGLSLTLFKWKWIGNSICVR